MIKSIKLINFFGFYDQCIPLNDLNVLMGINGSGKSNLIKAIRLLKAATTEGGVSELLINHWGGFDAVMFCGQRNDDITNIRLEFEFDPTVLSHYGYSFREAMYYSVWINKVPGAVNFTISEKVYMANGYEYMSFNRGRGFLKQGSGKQETVNYDDFNIEESILSQINDKERYPQLFALREAIKDISVYNYFDTTASSPIRKAVPVTSSNKLNSDGSNLIQVFNQIKVNDKPSWNAIRSALNEINPNFEDIDFEIKGANIEMLLEEKGLNRSVHVTHVSDGTLRYLCLLAILLNKKRGRMVCIDEPEVGLHPDMITMIGGYLGQQCESSQFLISSHSATLMNQFEVKDVVVLDKNEDNQTEVQVFRDKQYRKWAEDYTLGQLWTNGSLGGNRF